MEVDWLRREQKHPHIFSRQLEELGIINISRELVAYFSKKFADLRRLNAEAGNVGPKDLNSAYVAYRTFITNSFGSVISSIA